MTAGTCPRCGVRRARRRCPALGRDICATCCATGREREIACPPACGFLASARAHPPAAVRRAEQAEAALVVQLIDGLEGPAAEVVGLAQRVVADQAAALVPPLLDADVADAAAAVAATLETSARGIIYAHTTASVPAGRLAAAIEQALGQAGATRDRRGEQAAARALRRLERTARDAGAVLSDRSPRAFVVFLDRLGRRARAQPDQAAPAAPRLILP